MSYICENCGKKTGVGRSKSHKRGVAGKRWKKRAQVTRRLFKPNLQWATFAIAGKRKRMRLCTDCLGLFRKKYSSKVASLTT